MDKYRTGLLAAGSFAVALLLPQVALAGLSSEGGTVPAPGILGLVALGVIGAIAIARHRK